MKVTYDGPNAAVVVHVGDGVYVGAERGDTIDVPADTGKNLLEQGWKNPNPGADKEKDA